MKPKSILQGYDCSCLFSHGVVVQHRFAQIFLRVRFLRNVVRGAARKACIVFKN